MLALQHHHGGHADAKHTNSLAGLTLRMLRPETLQLKLVEVACLALDCAPGVACSRGAAPPGAGIQLHKCCLKCFTKTVR